MRDYYLKNAEFVLKQTSSKPHSKTHIPAGRIHERVHSDTIGPITGEKGRRFYITTLIDEHTRYVEILITETRAIKQQILNRLKVWNNRFPNLPIRFFRSDNASEMPTKEELEELGIEKDPISSYSLELNGLAEAVNKILITRAAKIVKPFENSNYFNILPSVFEHAAYTTNLLLPRNREMLPYTDYTKLEATDKNYMMFGIDVIVLIASKREADKVGVSWHKSHKSVQGIYVGHNGGAGYKVLVNFKLIETKNLTFGNKMDNLMDYFKRVSEMKLENVHPHMNMIDQFIQATKINKFVLVFPHSRPIDTINEEEAIETEPLTEAVQDSTSQAL